MKAASLAAVAPYVVWMALLFALPATAASYALRTALAAFLLVCSCRVLVPALRPWSFASLPKTLLSGLSLGALVAFLWIFPERFALYRDTTLFSLLSPPLPTAHCPLPTVSPYDPATCGWPLTLVKVFGSAFVIAPIEEIFFRSFLYRSLQRGPWLDTDPRRFDCSAFLWMVALFALEHHTRLLAGAMAGAFYGFLAVRHGLASAILAHVTTNLLLALYVLSTGSWALW